ncbi:MAG TPA: hypothetical protein PLG73_10110 [Candidatus Sumerlaeota bacterium]|nr:hypothetical protein [Candidatus Sumerlaeota bacterium]
MGLRDQIRSATVGASKVFPSEQATACGQNIEIRQPTLAGRDQIYEKAKDAKGTFQGARLAAAALIGMCYVPRTDERVFDDADFDTLVAMPAGGWADDLGNRCIRLMNGTKEAQEEVEKN